MFLWIPSVVAAPDVILTDTKSIPVAVKVVEEEKHFQEIEKNKE